MEIKYIEQLLENYWECKTTPEEEALLRNYFVSDDVPQHLQSYRAVFLAEESIAQEHLGADFDARMLKAVKESEKSSIRVFFSTFNRHLMPLYRAAAIVILILGVGTLADRSFHSNRGIQAPTGDVAEDPDIEFNQLPGTIVPGTSASADNVHGIVPDVQTIDTINFSNTNTKQSFN